MTSRIKLIAGIVVFAVLVAGLALLYHERRLVAACRTVSQADDAQFRVAEDLFNQGSKAFSARSYSTASDLFDMADSKLGDIYKMVYADQDDTGVTLEAGRAAAKRSEFQLAAQIKQSAMSARLSSFRRKEHISERCHGILAKIGF